MKLAELLRLYIAVNRTITVAALAKDIGTSTATLSRVINGHNCDGKTIVKLFVWLFADDTEEVPA